VVQKKMQAITKLVTMLTVRKKVRPERHSGRSARHLFSILGVLALAACVLSGCATDGGAAPVAPAAASSTSATSDFNKALSLVSANHCGRAVPLFLSAIAKDGPGVNEYRGLASCYAALGLPNKGLKAFDNAIALDPTNYGLYNDRAIAEAGLGDTGAAAIDAQTALRFSPNQVPAYISISNAFGDFQDFADAVMVLDKAIALVPNDPTLYEKRALIHLNNMGDSARAFADYQHAIQVAPFIAARADIYSKLADVYKTMTDYNSAYKTIKIAINLQPANAAYYLQSAQIHQAGGALDEALQLYNQTLGYSKTGPNGLAAYQGKSAIYTATNDKKNALLAYEAALRLAPDASTRASLRAAIKTLTSAKKP